MNFSEALSNEFNYKLTENGAVAKNATNSAVLDLFAFGGAYRSRFYGEQIELFKKAFKENRSLALKCLFYLRDCRGGQGERQFFRNCIRWLANEHPDNIRPLIQYIPLYGRWDDLFALFNSSLEKDVITLVGQQLTIDTACNKNAISLCAKWCPSENASSNATKLLAKKLRKGLHLSAKEYRKILSFLRSKINILERLMSSNRWDEIEFDKIPSKAGLIYRNAFARREITALKYKEFLESKDTKVNASTLYPYEIVKKARDLYFYEETDPERLAINKYWENLPDYFENKPANMLCVVDTSGSMTSCHCGTAPIDVAISLGIYCAEHNNGSLANRYISFSSRPQLIKIEGQDFVEKVGNIYQTNLIENTNLDAVFDLILNAATRNNLKQKDLPETIIVISDMEIDAMSNWTKNNISTNMEIHRKKWLRAGYSLPNIVYWNVDARNNTILDEGEGVSFVSGCSPVIFKSILSGKTGYELMLETLLSERYFNIK